MSDRNSPIGILDSGIGGFSVALQVQRLLPGERLIYFGDGANVPYGNHPEETIVALSRYMFEFMEQQQVKVLLVACNTISCVVDRCRDAVSCPTFHTIQVGADAAVRSGCGRIGVISTVFTHNSGLYPKRIRESCTPQPQVLSRGCPDLARLVEHNLGSRDGMVQVEEELRRELSPLVEEQGIQCCLLGCTHYSLVADSIRRLYPDLALVDPAEEMARGLERYLETKDLKRTEERAGCLRIYTTGNPEEYALRAAQVGLERLDGVEPYPPMTV